MGRGVSEAAAHRRGVCAGRRSGTHAAEVSDGAARKRNAGVAPVSSQGADVGFAARVRSAMAGRISGNPESRAAGVAERRGVCSASADQPGGAARESAEAVSDQIGFDQQWLDEFLGILNREQPAWLSGVVFAPQVRISLAELRAKVPKRYPIRSDSISNGWTNFWES